MVVRVRFAPSPTGRLHLGSIRTALFNFVFVKSQKGVFILRIEDTDKERSKKEFVDDIIESLKWLNLNPDEGPIFQSERTEIYRKVIEELLDKGKAYRCFCTKEELDLKRQMQITKGEPPRYDGTCTKLSKEEVNEKLSRNIPYVIRLKVPDQILTFKDYLRGEIKFDLRLIGDFVIAKSETEPLFHLATPVDDYYQGITHVIRGAEHIPNTPKQILIFKVMNWKIPIYAHIPLILGEGGGKLSKRHGAKSVLEYRKDGYLPEAIINFLILLGWHPKGDKEVVSMNEIINEFKLEDVEKRPAVFNTKKLVWLNKVYMKRLSPKDIENLILNDPYLEDLKFYLEKTEYSKEKIYKIIELGKERANTIREIFETVKFFYYDFDYNKELLIWKDYTFEQIKNSLIQVKNAIENIPEDKFNYEYIKQVLDSLSEDRGYTYWPLRVALTGLEASPPPIDIMLVIGKEKTLKLIEKALEKLS
jgi:glutamyl-tRNA synthetase